MEKRQSFTIASIYSCNKNYVLNGKPNYVELMGKYSLRKHKMVFTVRQNAILALAVLFMHGKWGQGVMAVCDLFLYSDKYSSKWKICL